MPLTSVDRMHIRRAIPDNVPDIPVGGKNLFTRSTA